MSIQSGMFVGSVFMVNTYQNSVKVKDDLMEVRHQIPNHHHSGTNSGKTDRFFQFDGTQIIIKSTISS